MRAPPGQERCVSNLLRFTWCSLAGSPSISVLSAGRPGQPQVWRSESRTNAAGRAATSAFVPLFILSLALPIIFYAGPLRLSPYRVLLLALFLPCLMAWLAGQFGRVRLPDVLILMTCLWGMLALTINHGLEIAWQPAGILLIETFGAYLLARSLIRNEHGFRTMVGVLFWSICILVPFAVIESLTGRAIFVEVLQTVAAVTTQGETDMRYGFHRAQVVFEHPILYGVFCASGIGLTYYVTGPARSALGRLLWTAPVALAAMLSLSAGAAASIVSQVGLTGWDYVTRNVRHRWRLLGLLALVAYAVVDLLSNRTPFHIFVTYLTFSVETGYHRILIWNWGITEVMRQPLLGIGLGDWERPEWMSASMDNFWLVIAVRHGAPTFLMLAGAVAIIMRALGKARFDDESLRACRAGLLMTLAGLIIAGCTVHYWNALYVWFMFLLGSGVWMLDDATSTRSASDPRGGAVLPRPPRQSNRRGTKTCDAPAGQADPTAARRARRPPIRMS
jgi:hypothetical protein